MMVWLLASRFTTSYWNGCPTACSPAVSQTKTPMIWLSSAWRCTTTSSSAKSRISSAFGSSRCQRWKDWNSAGCLSQTQAIDRIITRGIEMTTQTFTRQYCPVITAARWTSIRTIWAFMFQSSKFSRRSTGRLKGEVTQMWWLRAISITIHERAKTWISSMPRAMTI